MMPFQEVFINAGSYSKTVRGKTTD